MNDTYLATWNALPPRRPNMLMAFLGKVTRHIAIDRWRKSGAVKRGGGQVEAVLDELSECIPGQEDVEAAVVAKELRESVNAFLDTLPETERKVFLCRYVLLDPIWEIAANLRFSQSKVTSMLHRTRSKLRKHLAKEGYL